jgi:hypothetical protein
MLKFLNILFFAGMVVMNYLANALPLNGKNTGELSDAFPNLFVPAGVTFSIWGIIYLLLLAFCIVQFSGVMLNALWIVCWHYGKIPLSVIVMLGLLATLIYVNLQMKGLPAGIIKASFGIYLGWICIATIASVTTLLVHTNWNSLGISAEIWTIVMIIIGAFITALAITRFNNYFIGLSVVWAFIGIIIKRHGDYRSIAITAAVAGLVVGIIVIRSFILKKPVL